MLQARRVYAMRAWLPFCDVPDLLHPRYQIVHLNVKK